MAFITITGQGMLAVAVQTRAHGMGHGGIGRGVALCTGNPGARMPRMVKMHMRRQWCTAHPGKRLTRVYGGVRVGSGMQGQQAGITTQYVAVAIQTLRSMGHTGTGALLCTGVAALALHIGAACRCMGSMAERHRLRHHHCPRGIRVVIDQQHGEHPRCHKQAEGVPQKA